MTVTNNSAPSYITGRLLPEDVAERADQVLYQGSEKDAKLAQKLGQLQPFMAVFSQECMGQLASSGLT
jgi:hypothetical protein